MIKCSKINTFKTKYYFEKCKKIPKYNIINKIEIKKHNTKEYYVIENKFLLNI